MTKYVTPRKAGEILQVSEKTLRNCELADKISAIRGRLNFKRKALLALLGQIVSGNISTIMVGHQDRLARFGGDLIKWICEQNNCQLMVLSRNELSPESEMVEDILAIIHVFRCRLYRGRKYKSTIKEDSSLPGNQVSSKMEDLDCSK